MAGKDSASRSTHNSRTDFDFGSGSASGSSATFKKPTKSSSKSGSTRHGSKDSKKTSAHSHSSKHSHSSSPGTEASHRSGGSYSSSHRPPKPRTVDYDDERRKELKDDEAFELNTRLDDNSARLERMERDLRELDMMLMPKKTKHRKGH